MDALPVMDSLLLVVELVLLGILIRLERRLARVMRNWEAGFAPSFDAVRIMLRDPTVRREAMDRLRAKAAQRTQERR